MRECQFPGACGRQAGSAEEAEIGEPVEDELHSEGREQHAEEPSEHVDPGLAEDAFEQTRGEEQREDHAEHRDHHEVHGEEVELYLIADGPDLLICDKGQGDEDESPIGTLRYAHPSLLHLPRQFVYPFDPDSEILARVEDDGLHIEGMPR